MSGHQNTTRDPLDILPPEIVLRILDFAPVSAVAALTRTSKAWHAFVDWTHQDHIYADPDKTERGPSTSRGDPSLHHRDVKTFTRYYDGVRSWKDLCRRQALLRRNWAASAPVTTESIYNINKEPV